jgi:hypothetical protein
MTAGVRAATPDELGILAAVLGHAYADDPVWNWVYPQPDRSRRLARMFRPLLRATQDRGATVLTDVPGAVRRSGNAPTHAASGRWAAPAWRPP